MTTKTVTLYLFNELSDSAKEKARNWWREGSMDDCYWSESTLDEAKEQAVNMGLDIDKIYFRGFSSQGDGACYVGKWHACDVKAGETAKDWGDSPATKEIKRIAESFKEFAKEFPESSFSVTHSGHYSHEYCTNFDISLGQSQDNLEGFTRDDWNAAESNLIEIARDYMRWIYKQLETEYDYQNSDECVDEIIINNDYSFLEDGTRED